MISRRASSPEEPHESRRSPSRPLAIAINYEKRKNAQINANDVAQINGQNSVILQIQRQTFRLANFAGSVMAEYCTFSVSRFHFAPSIRRTSGGRTSEETRRRCAMGTVTKEAKEIPTHEINV